MKLRVVLITENNVPVERLGANATDTVKEAWNMFMRMVEIDSDNGDRGYVESVEILED